MLDKNESENFLHHLVRRNQETYKLLLDREPSRDTNERIDEIASKVFGILKTKNNSVIITDDSQNIYGVNDFWSLILKNNQNIVISFASFRIDSNLGHASAPASFANQHYRPNNVESSLFSQKEFKELVKKQKRNFPDDSPVLSKRVCDEIFRITFGYPYLVYQTFNMIANFSICDPQIVDREEKFFTTYLGQNSHVYLNELSRIGKERCFKTCDQLEEQVQACFIKYKAIQLDEQVSSRCQTILKEWLQMLIYHDRLPTTWFRLSDSFELRKCYKWCLDVLVRSGVVIEDYDECYFFNKCFHNHYTQEYLKRWYSSQIGHELDKHDKELIMSFKIEEKAEFVKRIIENFNPDLLNYYHTRSKNSLAHFETSYDHLVYTSLLFLGFKSTSPQYNESINGKFSHIFFSIFSLIFNVLIFRIH